MIISWTLCILMLGYFCLGKAQYYPWSVNSSSIPYPYQTTLGLTITPETAMPNPQNMGIPSGQSSVTTSYSNGYPIPTSNQIDPNAYYAMLAQQGKPAYQYPGMGYPSYPVYPTQYIPQGYGFPYMGYPQPGFGYPLPGAYPVQFGTGFPQQPAKPDQQIESSDGIKTEILDVSPEYQRQLLGWPAQGPSGFMQTSNQGASSNRPRYTVDVNSQTSNNTVIPVNLTKPIASEKKYITSIRRTFVYDSSKPESIKPINLHIINGQQVTTTAPPETTENENVQGNSSVKPKGRRFMDVPKSCPRGFMKAHNGQCLAPFFLRSPAENATVTEMHEETSEEN